MELVVRDIPRDEGPDKKHLTARWEKTWETQHCVGVQSSLRGTRIQMGGVPRRTLCPGSFILRGHSLAQTSCANIQSGLH